MATWKLANNEPITVERERRVYCDDGREGYANVLRRDSGGVFPGVAYALGGPVTVIVKQFFNQDGSEYQEPHRKIIDDNPIFA